jgi:hypothetical protein
MIYDLKNNSKIEAKVYFNTCRQTTPGEYVTYKLLGYLDGYEK